MKKLSKDMSATHEHIWTSTDDVYDYCPCGAKRPVPVSVSVPVQPIPKPLSDQIHRILDTFEFMEHSGIYPANSSEEHDNILKADSDRIATRYRELRWRPEFTFSQAMRIAKAEYIYWVFSGYPTAGVVDLPAACAVGHHWTNDGGKREFDYCPDCGMKLS